MTKTLKKINLKIILVTFCLMTKGESFSQAFFSDSLAKQFISYQVKNYSEKIFVHIDKTFYVAGETIWFKLYCVDECFHKPSSISKVAYIEILGKENKPVLQAKIAMDEGIGKGSFIIPSFIASGNYKIRAYTKWMENFDADYFFEQQITIINTLKSGIWSDTKKEKFYEISFFPEGGNLVDGIPSKVAFKIVNEDGDPIDCSGMIKDDHNNTVTDFLSVKFGMGSFSLTPKEGVAYKAVIKLPDTILTRQIPISYKHGYVMQVENISESRVKILVSSNVSGEESVCLLVHSQNVIKDFQQGKLSEGQTVFVIDKNKLFDGISDFTIFNSRRQPVCERLYFKRPASSKLIIQAKTDHSSYQTRNPVNVSIATTNNSGDSVSANMSISVFAVDSLQSNNYVDILSYLLLRSELKGNIISPEYYFQNNSKEADEAADDLMLTQGWRRFKWDEVLQNDNRYFEFLPEYEGFIIDGKIMGKHNSLPLFNVKTTLSVPGQNFQLASTQSNALGSFRFNVKKFYGPNNVVTQTDSNYKAEIESPFAQKFSSSALSQFEMPLKWKDQLLFRSINIQAENAYFIDKKQRSYSYTDEDTSLFYGKPDKRYYLDNYTRFITMEEVMREYVTEVHVRKESEQFHFKVFNLPTKTYFDDDPLILFDGVPVSNTNDIINFDPLKIKRLDVVTHKYYNGNMISDGIVSYTTYNGDLADFTLHSGNVVIKFDGLQREREFYSPTYSKEQTNAHLPDLRNVLYWSPDVKTDKNGNANLSFYTSDVTGKFACVVQGITSNGESGSNTFVIEVNK
jgi:hypothetical protein